jgi:hypothetical protein
VKVVGDVNEALDKAEEFVARLDGYEVTVLNTISAGA